MCSYSKNQMLTYMWIVTLCYLRYLTYVKKANTFKLLHYNGFNVLFIGHYVLYFTCVNSHNIFSVLLFF